MRFAVASFVWNRPHLFDISMEYLAKCRGASEIDVHVYLDGGRSTPAEIQAIIDKHKAAFNAVTLTARPKNWGLSRNILIGTRETFEKGYDVVCLLESDVVCSKDFIEYHKYCHEHLPLEEHKVMAVSGYTKSRRQPPPNMNPAEAVIIVNWYTPDGVSFNRAEWGLVEERLDEYLKDPIGVLRAMKPEVLKVEPNREDMWVGDMPKFVAQAGYIQRIRAIHGKNIIIPILSRCQDIGFYGVHEPGGLRSYTGIDPRDKENWKRSYWYTTRFEEDYEWEAPRLVWE